MKDDPEVIRGSVEAALAHGVDILGRRIFLQGDIEESSSAVAIRGIYLLSAISPTKPIELLITSDGGEVEEAFALHDVTRIVKAPIHTIALGKCCSSAPLLVACGKQGERWSTENTIFMLHDTYLEDTKGSPDQVKAFAEAEQLQSGRFATLLGRYTKKPKRFWMNLYRKRADVYFDAAQALEWGLIDGIWSEKD